MQTAQEMRARIIEKATNDADFRKMLLDDPNAAVTGELGVAIPDSLTIRVHEEDADSAHLVLPPSSKLSEPELGAVAAGFRDTGGGTDSWRNFYNRDW